MSTFKEFLNESNKKYEITDEKTTLTGKPLYRIKALKSFGKVKAGDLGGYVESEKNLSQSGNAWVGDTAKVYDKAIVYGDAQVYGNAHVFGKAKVYDNAEVFDDAVVFDNAKVYGKARVGSNTEVSGNEEVSK